MTAYAERLRVAEMEAARKLGELPPMHLEMAIRELDSLDHDPESAHLEADRILLCALKGAGLHGVALKWLVVKEMAGFWYA